MFRNVLNALNEALDITLHLHPLIEHFKVVMLAMLECWRFFITDGFIIVGY